MSTNERPGIDRGYGFTLEFELQKADVSPEVVAGTRATWKIAASAEAATALLTKADLEPETVRGKSVVTLELSGAETETLSPGQYYHQLAVTPDGGVPKIYFRGWLPVRERL
ncbi:hypothetical protein WDZ92_01015 [Nostoc sp. NIES-2111]